MSLYLLLTLTLAALFLGFLAGLLTFRVKQRWCPACGRVLRCPTCAPAFTIAQART